MTAHFLDQHASRQAGSASPDAAEPSVAQRHWAWEVPRDFRPLAGSLIRRIVLLAVLCMALVLAGQTWYLLRQHEERFATQVDGIVRTSVPQLATALWDIELESVQRQVQAISTLPEVGHVRLRTATGPVFMAGDPAAREAATVVRRMDILPLPGQGSTSLPLGQLEIVGNPRYVLGEVRASAVQVLLGYGVYTTLVCLLVTWLLRRRLQQPLEEMARFAAELTPDHLMTPPPRQRAAPQRGRDEIDLLADGFVKLQAGLREHIDGLDEKVAQRTDELQRLVDEVYRLSRTDAVTGCWNRRTLDERLPLEVERVQRYGRPLSLLQVSIDRFRERRQELGPTLTDDLLREVARIGRLVLRNEVDWLAREDGGQFVIVLPETDLSEAMRVAERLRLGVAAIGTGCGQSAAGSAGSTGPEANKRLSASVGVAQYRSGEPVHQLLARAAEGVRQAQAAGGDRLASV
ncbi:GGDEF domain-containing protein [Hylemonella gracilis]|uniref:diguanylate cyclase n=1 Tax=Hylemonella gracilis ATCC 19624 TaxID=887062 RepID=F3KRB4_9BURK|nr:GGDEF domain-containing protein [Hylemonella gracilis]EGI77815.1 GGDEF protein [Hylemonella gracilis ATCC 19624]